MNSEVISSRYAKALLAYAAESGSANIVYSQAQVVVHMMEQLPDLKELVVKCDELPLDKKIELLSIAIGETLADQMVRFIELVHSHHRMDMFLFMMVSYISRYRQANNIKVGTLLTAVPDENLKKRLETMFSERTDSQVHLKAGVDPQLLGGFVFELDGCRLDASVRTRLEKIRQCLVDDNSRIV